MQYKGYTHSYGRGENVSLSNWGSVWAIPSGFDYQMVVNSIFKEICQPLLMFKSVILSVFILFVAFFIYNRYSLLWF